MPYTKKVIYRIEVFEDGVGICALIGENLQTGIAGFGKTSSEALRDLADNLGHELAHHAMTGE